MPHFPDNPLDKLALETDGADADLDLRGLPHDQAMARVEAFLRAPPAHDARRWRLLFDGPSGDGQETLFQPLGRRLLEARRRGTLARCLPLPDGNGYVIDLPA